MGGGGGGQMASGRASAVSSILLNFENNSVPSGHILTRRELQVLATLLAAYSDEKLKEIKVALQEDESGDISREGVEESLRQNGLATIADGLKENLQKGITLVTAKYSAKVVLLIFYYSKDGP